jgi:hypothetical protein
MYSLTVSGVCAEGEPPSKKAKWSPDEHQSLDPVNQIESKVAARYGYFKKLLEAPLELPKSTKDLWKFLSLRKEKLPLIQETTYWNINESELVKLYCTTRRVTLGIVSQKRILPNEYSLSSQ